MRNSTNQNLAQHKLKRAFLSGRVKWPASIAVILGLILGFALYSNRLTIFDWFSSLSFHPTAEVTTIKDRLALTSKASLIFSATHPSLETQDDFNEHCRSHDQDISVLGCYTKGHIYVYDVESAELAGIKESTAAHELLHAAWARLSAGEKNELTKSLTDVYNDNKYHELLAEDLETYGDAERIEELHSRIGTEIADLPDTLEKHYAKYFADQDYIVEFYNSYITPFKELSEEIDSLSEELENLDAEIEQKTANYYKAADDLSAKVDDFNRCANTSGCFVTDTVFYARRSELLSQQSALEDMYEELNSLIDQYNALVVEYNANVLRGEVLEKAINSNAKTNSLN